MRNTATPSTHSEGATSARAHPTASASAGQHERAALPDPLDEHPRGHGRGELGQGRDAHEQRRQPDRGAEAAGGERHHGQHGAGADRPDGRRAEGGHGDPPQRELLLLHRPHAHLPSSRPPDYLDVKITRGRAPVGRLAPWRSPSPTATAAHRSPATAAGSAAPSRPTCRRRARGPPSPCAWRARRRSTGRCRSRPSPPTASCCCGCSTAATSSRAARHPPTSSTTCRRRCRSTRRAPRRPASRGWPTTRSPPASPAAPAGNRATGCACGPARSTTAAAGTPRPGCRTR